VVSPYAMPFPPAEPGHDHSSNGAVSNVTTAGRRKRSDRQAPPCSVCGGSRHQHNQKLAEDFRCYWTQFSRTKNLDPGDMLPFRRDLVIEFANWVEGNARPRPKRLANGEEEPPPEGARVRFFN
jgi:hypothetical protein